MATPEILGILKEMSDPELELLLAYVDDEPMAFVEREKAREKIDELRSLVYGTSS